MTDHILAERRLSALCTLHLLETPHGLRLSLLEKSGRGQKMPTYALPEFRDLPQPTMQEADARFARACENPTTESRLRQYLNLMEEEE